MAVNLISQPKKYSPAHWSVPFSIELTDLGTPPTRIDFGYYLAESGGTRLMEDKKHKPFAISTPFVLDFKSNAARQVYTSFPTQSATQQTDSNIIKALKLKYGTVSYNGSTCETVKAISSDSNVFYAINSAANTDTHSLFGDSSGFTGTRTGLLLSQRPDRWKLLYGSRDYLWFLGVGTIEVKYFNGSSQVGATQTFTLTGSTTVKYVCLDYSLYSISTPLTHATVTMWDGANGDNGKTYQIYYCNCADQDDYIGILFLEPLGGRAMMATGPARTTQLERSATDVFKPMDLTQTNHKTGGRSAIYSGGRTKLTFNIQFEIWPGIERYLQNFCSSVGFHAQKGYGANTRWEKFILDTGSIQIKERNSFLDFEFSGLIAEDFNVQNEDI